MQNNPYEQQKRSPYGPGTAQQMQQQQDNSLYNGTTYPQLVPPPPPAETMRKRQKRAPQLVTSAQDPYQPQAKLRFHYPTRLLKILLGIVVVAIVILLIGNGMKSEASFTISKIVIVKAGMTRQYQNGGLLVDAAASAIAGLLLSLFIFDWRGFTSINGLLKWDRIRPIPKLIVGGLFLFFSPYILPIYLIAALFHFRKFQQPATPLKSQLPRRAKVGMLIGALVALLLFVALALNTLKTT